MSFPLSLDVETPDRMANWRPLVQWILAIPHLIVAAALSSVADVVAIISWFVILFTGRMPEGLAKFQVMIMRYTLRAYTYAGFLYTDYPPFNFEMDTHDPGGSPARLSVTPALVNRNRLNVLLRLIWMIPAMIFTLLITIVGLVCVVLGFFAVLLTGRWPDGLRHWYMAMLRVGTRLNVYYRLLTDEYPPFEIS